MRFVEAPKFLITEFMRTLLVGTTSTEVSGSFMGGIITPALNYFDVIIETDGNNYAIPFLPYKLPDDDFIYIQRLTNLETAATSAMDISSDTTAHMKKSSVDTEVRVDITNGTEVYGALFDVFVRNLAETTPSILDFVNVQKVWIYLGKIYAEAGYTDRFRIEMWGMDRYAISCLPPHLQTTKIKSFFKLYFDEIYNKVYNKEKFVITLLDALEVDLNFIGYLADLYNVSIDKGFTDALFLDLGASATRKNERKLREYVRELPNFLKRKGAYSSLYVLFKNFFNKPMNLFSVYERWHKRSLCNGWPADPTAIPLPPATNFVDLDYLNFYGESTTQCVSGWNLPPPDAGYSMPSENCWIHRQVSPSDHWRIIHLLNDTNPIIQCFDLDLNLIVPAEILAVDKDSSMIIFQDGWGRPNPTSGFALMAGSTFTKPISATSVYWDHNLDQIPIITGYRSDTFTLNAYNTFDAETAVSLENVTPTSSNRLLITNFQIEDDMSVACLSADYFHYQTDSSDSWFINHNLNSKAVIVDFYTSQPTTNWTISHALDTQDLIIQPQTITDEIELLPYLSSVMSSTSSLEIIFDDAVSGVVLLKKADEVVSLPATQDYTLTYSASGSVVPIVEVYNDAYTKMNCDIYTRSNNSLTIDNHNTSGYVEIVEPQYTKAFCYRDNIWNINHQLNSQNIIVNIYSAISDSTFEIVNNYGSDQIFAQAFNSDGRMVDTATITEFTITVSPTAACEVFVNSYSTISDQPSAGRFTYTPAVSGDCWWVEHYLDTYAINIRVYDTESIEVTACSIQIYNENWVNILFDAPADGHVDIYLSDECYIPSIKIEADDYNMSAVDDNNFTISLPSSAMGYVSCAVTDVQCTNLYQASPQNYNIYDNNKAIATFDQGVAGVSVVKKVGQLTYSGELMLSPHYKAVLDVNCQPLNEPDIIEANVLKQFVGAMEDARPACKYSHYNIFISPKSDFTDDVVDIYDNRFDGSKIYTISMCSETTSGCYVYSSCMSSSVWEVDHNLGSEKVLVQCYDLTGYILHPLEIRIIDANTIQIMFYGEQRGFALIMKSSSDFINDQVADDRWVLGD